MTSDGEIREAERKVVQASRLVVRVAAPGTLIVHVEFAVDELRRCLSELDALRGPERRPAEDIARELCPLNIHSDHAYWRERDDSGCVCARVADALRRERETQETDG